MASPKSKIVIVIALNYPDEVPLNLDVIQLDLHNTMTYFTHF